jgi:hypothetical protein
MALRLAAVVGRASFTRAADHLGLSASALSQTIRDGEKTTRKPPHVHSARVFHQNGPGGNHHCDHRHFPANGYAMLPSRTRSQPLLLRDVFTQEGGGMPGR